MDNKHYFKTDTIKNTRIITLTHIIITFKYLCMIVNNMLHEKLT